MSPFEQEEDGPGEKSVPMHDTFNNRLYNKPSNIYKIKKKSPLSVVGRLPTGAEEQRRILTWTGCSYRRGGRPDDEPPATRVGNEATIAWAMGATGFRSPNRL